MLGFKRFRNAAITISGIELMHRIRKGTSQSSALRTPLHPPFGMRFCLINKVSVFIGSISATPDIFTGTLVGSHNGAVDEDLFEVGIARKLSKYGMPHVRATIWQSAYTHCSKLQNQKADRAMDCRCEQSKAPLRQTVDCPPPFDPPPWLRQAAVGQSARIGHR
jgi:hypothetical protein